MPRKKMENDESMKHALVPLYILDILRRYAQDAEHRLNHDAIGYYLQEEYGIFLERKAVSRYINYLIEWGDVAQVEGKRGCYYNAFPFSGEEARLLMLSLKCSSYVSEKTPDLMEKLQSMAPAQAVPFVTIEIPDTGNGSESLEEVAGKLGIIEKAIREGREVQFDYTGYMLDKKTHSIESICMSPLNVLKDLEGHNRLELMGFETEKMEFNRYRIDRIRYLTVGSIIGGEKPRPEEEPAEEKQLKVGFTADKKLVNEIIEQFGLSCSLKQSRDDKERIYVTAEGKEDEITRWLLAHPLDVQVTAPFSFRKKMQDIYARATQTHGPLRLEMGEEDE